MMNGIRTSSSRGPRSIFKPSRSTGVGRCLSTKKLSTSFFASKQVRVFWREKNTVQKKKDFQQRSQAVFKKWIPWVVEHFIRFNPRIFIPCRSQLDIWSEKVPHRVRSTWEAPWNGLSGLSDISNEWWAFRFSELVPRGEKKMWSVDLYFFDFLVIRDRERWHLVTFGNQTSRTICFI